MSRYFIRIVLNQYPDLPRIGEEKFYSRAKDETGLGQVGRFAGRYPPSHLVDGRLIASPVQGGIRSNS